LWKVKINDMKNAKALMGNLIFFGCIITIALSYYFGDHSLLPVTYGLFFGYLWRVIAEIIEEAHEKRNAS